MVPPGLQQIVEQSANRDEPPVAVTQSSQKRPEPRIDIATLIEAGRKVCVHNTGASFHPEAILVLFSNATIERFCIPPIGLALTMFGRSELKIESQAVFTRHSNAVSRLTCSAPVSRPPRTSYGSQLSSSSKSRPTRAARLRAGSGTNRYSIPFTRAWSVSSCR